MRNRTSKKYFWKDFSFLMTIYDFMKVNNVYRIDIQKGELFSVDYLICAISASKESRIRPREEERMREVESRLSSTCK